MNEVNRRDVEARALLPDVTHFLGIPIVDGTIIEKIKDTQNVIYSSARQKKQEFNRSKTDTYAMHIRLAYFSLRRPQHFQVFKKVMDSVFYYLDQVTGKVGGDYYRLQYEGLGRRASVIETYLSPNSEGIKILRKVNELLQNELAEQDDELDYVIPEDQHLGALPVMVFDEESCKVISMDYIDSLWLHMKYDEMGRQTLRKLQLYDINDKKRFGTYSVMYTRDLLPPQPETIRRIEVTKRIVA